MSPVIILVADGARPDTLAAALDDGSLPALATLRAEGGLHTVASVFPSVTGPAYSPFLMGRFPAPVGLPGIRWFDRVRSLRTAPDSARSYVSAEMRHLDGDLAPDAPTLFELAPPGLGALSVIGRGLSRDARLGNSLPFALRAAHTHFRGDVAGWLTIDRDVGGQVARRIRQAPASERPRVVYCALTGVDKTSHQRGHDAPIVRDALRIVDQTAAEIRHDAERGGWWPETHIWIVSDHGHSPVREHDDLVDVMRGLGHPTISHPFTMAPRRDVAVMVSGNAMAHIYVELRRRVRPWWPELAPRWEAAAGVLLARPSVDLLLLPHAVDRCEVRAPGRGRAFVERTPCGTPLGVSSGNGLGNPLGTSDGTAPAGAYRYAYRPVDGDPLGLGGPLGGLSSDEAYDACAGSDYPDALVQIAHLAGAPRSGELIVSAARDWDLRSRYEPIRHVSSHGALHREHMLVPLLLSRPAARAPRRTVDVMPSALTALGLPIPSGLDGASFL